MTSNCILATACQEQDWRAVCLWQLPLLPPEAVPENVQPQRTETRQFSLTCWACVWEAASWLWAGLPSTLPARDWEQRLAGGLAHFPCSPGALQGCLATTHRTPLQHRAGGSGAQTAAVARVWRNLCRLPVGGHFLLCKAYPWWGWMLL